MTLDALGNIGDFLGGLGVLVTLLYLAVQIRQNTAQVRLNTATNQWHGILHAFDPLYDGGNASLLRRGLDDLESLETDEGFTWAMLMTRIFGQFEMSLYQLRRDALDPELFAMHSRLLAMLIHSPGGRAWWKEIGHRIFGAEFRAHVEGIASSPSEFAQGVEEYRSRRRAAAGSPAS